LIISDLIVQKIEQTMSAYALPGSFPPMGCSSYDKQTNVCAASRPLHHFGDMKAKNGGIGYETDPLQSYTTMKHSDGVAEKCPMGTRAAEVGIAVTEAKIDPVRLVQALTSLPDASRSWKNGSSLDKQHKNAPHEDAIQFELTIKFNGRTYCATRTLPRIMELRNDLIREINTRRQRLQSKRMRWQFRSANEEEDVDVTIPELPECDNERVAVGGVAGRGFAMLQALLRPYCPAMERWFRNVTDLIPPNSSPSLTNFLWEPVSVDVERKDDSRMGRLTHSSSLECIEEDDAAEEECDCVDGREESEP
jgi:hypothetical protein